jgi:cytoskeleton protein RodZ
VSDQAPIRPDAADHAAAVDAASAGTLLRSARERAGMSLDDISQQLKLAPRQVQALEDGDFAALPGRTFIRGFVRNYARLLKLDVAAVLAALPGASADSGLQSPTLHPTAPSIGELPESQYARPVWIRWAVALIALVLVALVAYEFLPPLLSLRQSSTTPPTARDTPAEAKPAAEAADAATTAAPAPEPAPQPSAAAGTPLPNPILNREPATAAPAAAADGSTKAPDATAVPQAGERELTLAYRDNSWTEVRDRDGRVLLSAMMPAGTRRALTGVPPFELIIGNATDVTLSFDGRSVDLTPFTRQGVARLTLR